MNLENLSAEELRKCWYKYDSIPTYIFDIAFEHWSTKHPLEDKSIEHFDKELVEFVKNKKQLVTELHDLSNKERFLVHKMFYSSEGLKFFYSS